MYYAHIANALKEISVVITALPVICVLKTTTIIATG